jgi:hypothetical protein
MGPGGPLREIRCPAYDPGYTPLAHLRAHAGTGSSSGQAKTRRDGGAAAVTRGGAQRQAGGAGQQQRQGKQGGAARAGQAQQAQQAPEAQEEDGMLFEVSVWMWPLCRCYAASR